MDIDSRLQIGIRNPEASHPRMGKSVFSMAPGSRIVQRGGNQAIIGPESVVHVEGNLELGSVRVHAGLKLICGDSIRIGDRVSIAWDVTILDDNRHELTIDGQNRRKTGPIHIGDDVWIGHSSAINKGVTIGDGAIVASKSVVVDDVPEETLVAGCPAEPIARGDIDWVHRS